MRVGGRVESVARRRLTLDDGTARGTVRLADTIGRIDADFEVGEVINVIGRVERRGGRSPEVVVASAADLRRAAAVDIARSESTQPVSAAVAPGALADVAASKRPSGLGEPAPVSFAVWPAVALVALGLLSLGSVSGAAFLAWRAARPSRPAEGSDAEGAG